MPGAVSTGTNAVAVAPAAPLMAAAATPGLIPHPEAAQRRPDALGLHPPLPAPAGWHNPNVGMSYESIYALLHPIFKAGNALPPGDDGYDAAANMLEDVFKLPFKINRGLPIFVKLDEPVPPHKVGTVQENALHYPPDIGYLHNDNFAFADMYNQNAMMWQGTIVSDVLGPATGTPYSTGQQSILQKRGSSVVATAWDASRCDHYKVLGHEPTRKLAVVWFYRHRSPEEVKSFINGADLGVHLDTASRLSFKPGYDPSADAWEVGDNGTLLATYTPGEKPVTSWFLPQVKRSERWPTRWEWLTKPRNTTYLTAAFVDASCEHGHS